LWGYWKSDFNSLTGLIPAAIGIFILAFYQWVKAENMIIAVTLNLIVFATLFLRLPSILGEDAVARIALYIIMANTIFLAVAYFTKSFREAIRARYNA
jgi:hypothetical protein